MVFVVSHETTLQALGLRQVPGQYLYKSATTALPSQPFPSLSPVRDIYWYYTYYTYILVYVSLSAFFLSCRYGSELLVVEETVQNNFSQFLAAQELRDWNDKSYWIGKYYALHVLS